ncbi:4-hydroxybenzoate octaprenyltransferase [Sandaracinobacter sp. RS1-74]|uniref:4-hydroxybenzoate octaprenyltransferase n=1 Tax=Sandaracinobacteroides sayramensis TaxID=2913411 RepID=UPI001EDA48A5|nr:4-hydroxybenzoate octaprenyltransferase [Sandaracinobacteroides sayramensis]MCG2839994.1 4-hydroxybenzoate octaprenyltransferase [Sandaracinobacteroides sayramensis]
MTPDAIANWVDRLPPRAALYARLGRFDRPAGIWLLFWPCLFGAFLAPVAGWWPLWPLFFLGSVAMRTAGCVYNDIVDRDLDAQVARTASRPVASGAISVKRARLFLLLLSLVGLGVLLALPRQAQWVALASLMLVAGYPFMKRITWWPQAWLGLTFNWGIPVGWAAADPTLRADLPVMLLVYGAAIAWTLGYDSIYATQDVEDDALAGVKSSARAMGAWLKPGVGLFYALTVALMALALWRWGASWPVIASLIPAAAHLGWQAVTLQPTDTQSALKRFRANQFTGPLLLLPILLAAIEAGA